VSGRSEEERKAWEPVRGQIMTRWAAEVSPETAWREYPRPQLRRPDWLNLNGLWEYAVTPRGQAPTRFEGEILVPFAIESALSGVKRPLQPSETLWYRRTFSLPASWRGRKVLLHFGAVDWEATVWVNGRELGTHRGGYLPFSFEITGFVDRQGEVERQTSSVKLEVPDVRDERERGRAGSGEGIHELHVAVWDPTDRHWQQRGKQVLKSKGIWYTAVSGIWQTVWLEAVPDTYVDSLKVTPDIQEAAVRVEARLSGAVEGITVRARALEGGEETASASVRAGEPLTLRFPSARLWSPDDPYLYDLEVEVRRGGEVIDRVESYFGMRSFGMGKDERGRPRLCLNGRPLFQVGPLDQGYWPDGLYTPPSEAAMRRELALVKALGCNMVRKHVKVEPALYYCDCDRLGLIVWQDMPNGGRALGALLSFVATLSGRLKRRDDRWRRMAGRDSAAAREDFRRELREMVDHLYGFPCIGVWVPFNEGWGQFDAAKTAEWLRAYDPTRAVDHASGWFDQGGGEMRSLHVYFKALPGDDPGADRALVLSEFGGYALTVPGHAWESGTEFGYRKFASRRELTEAYVELVERQLKPWIEKGLSAAVYTQLTDVETELNGFLTYDRVVAKMEARRVAEAHRSLR